MSWKDLTEQRVKDMEMGGKIGGQRNKHPKIQMGILYLLCGCILLGPLIDSVLKTTGL